MGSADNPDRRASRRTAKRIAAPQGVSGQRTDGALTASIRMLTARALLRHRRDPATVAEATQVPQRLVELMRDTDTPADPPPTADPNHLRHLLAVVLPERKV